MPRYAYPSYSHMEIYTAGSHIPRTDAGGYGVVIAYGGHVLRMDSGSFPRTLVSRMHLYAAVKGLELSSHVPCETVLYTPSMSYVWSKVNKGWLARWINTPHLDDYKEIIVDCDLWERLGLLIEERDVQVRLLPRSNGSELASTARSLALSSALRLGNIPRPDSDNIVSIYTDGSHNDDTGNSGYGFVVLDGDTVHEVSEGFASMNTTINRMEIQALIEALDYLPSVPRYINIYSDSRHVVDAVSRYKVQAWRRNNWKYRDGSDVNNVDLWKRCLPLLERNFVQVEWIAGHAGNVWNECADRLARTAAREASSRRELVRQRRLTGQGCAAYPS